LTMLARVPVPTLRNRPTKGVAPLPNAGRSLSQSVLWMAPEPGPPNAETGRKYDRGTG
jgi:hypothetical protein